MNASWQGRGPCYSSRHYNNVPTCRSPIDECGSIQVAAPRMAFMVVGMPRGFLSEGGYKLFAERVVRSFAAHTASRVFLHLKMGAEKAQWDALANATSELLHPATVSTPREESSGQEVYRDVHRRAARGEPLSTSTPLHPECFWRDEAPHYPLSQARVWWSTMNDGWQVVVEYEIKASVRFDAVVFTRPDLFWEANMGPWCAYDLGTMAAEWSGQWYTPAGSLTPDMFWVLPRRTAAAVLSTWVEIIVPCRPGQPCCNFTFAQPPHARVPYSIWLREYWHRVGGFTLNQTLPGFGRVGANPKKAHRNCTMHLGCMPRGETRGTHGRGSRPSGTLREPSRATDGLWSDWRGRF